MLRTVLLDDTGVFYLGTKAIGSFCPFWLADRQGSRIISRAMIVVQLCKV